MKIDRISGIILSIIGVVVLLTSLSYPIGTLRKPGGGFFPLIASVLLLGLSALLIFQSFMNKDLEKSVSVSFFPSGEARKRIILAFAALLGYRYLFPVIGFAPSTGFLIFVLARFHGYFSWKISIVFALTTAVVAYYLFQVWLKVPMPIPMISF